MREIALDTETTGLDPSVHRVIEIGCVEIVNRQITENTYRQVLNPGRSIDAEARSVHGFRDEDLQGQSRFGEIVDEFIAFISGAHLLMHNASFDQAFIDRELELCGHSKRLESIASGITDTLELATSMFPTKRVNLNTLCQRFSIDTSERKIHGALKDASLLARLYLRMTGGQLSIFETAETGGQEAPLDIPSRIREDRNPVVVRATPEEIRLHEEYMEELRSAMANDD